MLLCKLCEFTISPRVRRGEEIYLGTCKACQAQEDLRYTPQGLPIINPPTIDRGFDNRLPKCNIIDPFEHTYKNKAREKRPPTVKKFRR